MDIGESFNAEFNSGTLASSGFYQTTTRGGKRGSVVVAYLKPAMKRANLTVKTDVTVLRIIIEKSRAIGVEIIEGGQVKRLDAQTEVIITAGAIGSPKLLMLSGIGPAKLLKSVDVETRHDLPGVGQNFTDHFSTDVTWVFTGPVSYDRYTTQPI